MKKTFKHSIGKLWFFFLGQLAEVLLLIIANSAGVRNIIVWAAFAGLIILGCLYFGMCMAATDVAEGVKAYKEKESGR